MLRFAAALLLAVGPTPDGAVEFSFEDPEIGESSGLVVDASSGLFVTTNDSGDAGRLFVVDPTTGRTVGVTRWRSSTGEADPVDVEALAPAGPGEVWVADIGDNGAERDAVRLFRVPVDAGERDVRVEAHELSYPDGPRDAESLLVDPDGRVVIITKGLFGGEVLRADQPLATSRPTTLKRIGTALPIATDAAFFPDGRHLIVRSYGSAVVYAYPSLEEIGGFGLPDQEQGEGIAIDATGAVFVSSEGEGSQVLRVRLPDDVRREVAPPEPTPSAGSTDPGAEPGRADPTPSAEAESEPEREKAADPALWRWGVGGLVGLGIVLVLVRSLRPGG